MEPNAVAQGMATLEQEQQLWRPGVKAEQVFVYDFPFTMYFSFSERLYFSFPIILISKKAVDISKYAGEICFEAAVQDWGPGFPGRSPP